MRRALALLVALTASVPLRAETPDRAITGLTGKWGAHSSWFSAPHLSSGGHLVVNATEEFLLAGRSAKKSALQELADSWRGLLAGQAPAAVMIEVRGEVLGALWLAGPPDKSGKSRLSLVDRWDDTSFPWLSEAAQRDRWFLFAGGQSVSGGDIGSSTGFNLRLGTTLFHNRYDLAFLFNKTSTGPTPKVKANAYGVVGRALFRRSAHWGYNVGGQVTMISGSGSNEDKQLSAVAGVNMYEGRGSWDLSLTMGDEGSRTLVLGYSLFLTR